MITLLSAQQATAEVITTTPVPAPSMGTQQVGEACKSIGNGDICLRLGDVTNNRADITVWYSKHAGDPVTIRLAYFPGDGIDEGPFTIYAGQVRGYIWRNVYLSSHYCFTGAIRQGQHPDWLIVTHGGEVCR
ncbi:hypothetical protein BBK82_14880 [Lentzea guizhouensis]|uniref:Uncharacterized protein n=1 Tax=Lentzea guizhouensis TaxID=1586287 RepID=A0A1B2HHG4_9PSEU|nr:hypothetical protein [Lentzea guizhouensis]ANZ37160.1 hypothetical protein BBK82_14880 [Lentzea guizhouensis]